MKNKREILSWLLVIMWMVLIAVMSNQPANISDSQSFGFIEKTKNLGINLSLIFGKNTNFIVRKCAHFLEYFILGVLINNALSFKMNMNRLIIISIICSALYASTDEIHQIFIPGRQGTLRDVLIDTCGAGTGIFIKTYLQKRKGAVAQ